MTTAIEDTTRIVEDVVIPAINIKRLTVQIESWPGSSLIMHRFGEKARKQIADKQAQKANAPRKKRNPQAEYRDAFHRLPDGTPGIPSAAFKGAILDAAASLAGMTRPKVARAIFIVGELVPIVGEPQRRDDYGRINNGMSIDLRYRPEFPEWSADVPIDYDADQISVEQITNLMQRAGFSSGVLDWRPSAPFNKTGNHGRFRVKGSQVVNE